MSGFVADLIRRAEKLRLPKQLVAGMLAAYNEGRLNLEETDADWHRPDFDFPDETWKELVDVGNYIIEGDRQGKLEDIDTDMILQLLAWIANELLKGGDTDD